MEMVWILVWDTWVELKMAIIYQNGDVKEADRYLSLELSERLLLDAHIWKSSQ